MLGKCISGQFVDKTHLSLSGLWTEALVGSERKAVRREMKREKYEVKEGFEIGRNTV